MLLNGWDVLGLAALTVGIYVALGDWRLDYWITSWAGAMVTTAALRHLLGR